MTAIATNPRKVFADPVDAGDQVTITATACLATANRQRRRIVARIEAGPDGVRVCSVLDTRRLAFLAATAMVAARIALTRTRA
jgi:hypothetical protein